MKIRKMEVADELFKGELEICVEFTSYDDMAGPLDAETYLYLTKDEIVTLRDHLTEILDNPA